jgi:hypothetical protein
VAGLRVLFDGEQMGEKIRKSSEDNARAVTEAVRETGRAASEQILTRGKADIADGGNFGSSRWQDGLRADLTQGGGNWIVSVFHDVFYFGVFEFGATIHGQPLLWIPLSFAEDAQGVLARNYPGALFRVDRTGKAPLLVSSDDKQPKYFGRDSVTIPQKFHIRDICDEVAGSMQDIYDEQISRLV